MLTKQKRFIYISVILIFTFGFGVYANSLKGDFVWDDTVLVRDNTHISDFGNIKNVFTEDIGKGGFARFNFYRPLQMFSYMLDFSLWKLNPAGYHLTNIFVHLLVALSVFWLVMLIFGNGSLSLATALLFVTCPAHTEAIAYISGRAEPLAALFLILSLIFYIKYSTFGKFRFFVLTAFVYVLAALSKENAFILPLLILFYSFAFKKKIKSGLFSVLIIITIFIALIKALFLPFIPVGGHQIGVFERIPGFFIALVNYLKILIFPFGLHMEYGNELFSFAQPKAIAGLVIFISLITFAFAKKESQRAVFFSIGWFLICIFPFSGIFRINAYMAEHWLYLPSIGFFLLIAYILTSKHKFYKPSILFLVIILIYYSYFTIKQNYTWKDSLTLYRYTLKFSPNSLRVNNNLCAELVSSGDGKEAVEFCKKAIAIDPYFSAAYCNLGNAYKNLGDHVLAEENYKKAIKISPGYEYAYKVLGDLYALAGRKDLAKITYEKALVINPLYIEAKFSLEKLSTK